MCMHVLTVKKMENCFKRIIAEFRDFVMMIYGRSNHVFDKDCFNINMVVGYKIVLNT